METATEKHCGRTKTSQKYFVASCNNQTIYVTKIICKSHLRLPRIPSGKTMMHLQLGIIKKYLHKNEHLINKLNNNTNFRQTSVKTVYCICRYKNKTFYLIVNDNTTLEKTSRTKGVR